VPSRSLAGIVVPNDQSASVGIAIVPLLPDACGVRRVVLTRTFSSLRRCAVDLTEV
jgi:hypothetical protein